jgi:polyphosphate kinase 2 (PPK2 family)
MVFFDRSWYNRAVVEPVNGFCTSQEYEIFMSQVNEFEKMLIQSDTHLIKIYFSITKKEQAGRFKDIKDDPLKKWKMTAVDERAQELWDDYTTYKERMFEKTDSDHAPWNVIDANDKAPARLETIRYILGQIPYE